jgi:hypothetical protein
VPASFPRPPLLERGPADGAGERLDLPTMRQEIRELLTILRYARERRDRIAARAREAATQAATDPLAGQRLRRVLEHHILVQGELNWLKREFQCLYARYRALVRQVQRPIHVGDPVQQEAAGAQEPQHPEDAGSEGANGPGVGGVGDDGRHRQRQPGGSQRGQEAQQARSQRRAATRGQRQAGAGAQGRAQGAPRRRTRKVRNRATGFLSRRGPPLPLDGAPMGWGPAEAA